MMAKKYFSLAIANSDRAIQKSLTFIRLISTQGKPISSPMPGQEFFGPAKQKAILCLGILRRMVFIQKASHAHEL